MLDPLTERVRRKIAAEVSSFFNDQARGERPVERHTDGLFGPNSIAWQVNGDVTSMMVGGVGALLLQMLHPAVLAGVWDHSNFRADMHGRLRRTARFIAVTTFGGRDEAEGAIAKVRTIHQRIQGTLPDGTAYAADDGDLLDWVHVTGAKSFLDGWIRYAAPRMPMRDQDRYFAEMAEVAVALGAQRPPRTRMQAENLVTELRTALRSDHRTQEVARLILDQPADNRLAEPLQRLVMRAGVDLLPGWARHMHGLQPPRLSLPLVRTGTYGIARTLRWAFDRPA
jgi:uncharacterized protein (DUF2236 family)